MTKHCADLEAEIEDLADMARVCIIVLETLQREEKGIATMAVPAATAAGHLEYWRHLHDFSVRHLVSMAVALRRKHREQDEAA